MASIIFLLAVFFILAALVGTLATGLVRILGLGILALFTALVVNMASSGKLPTVSFRNPFSPSAQQIPSPTETPSTSTANFDTVPPNSSNGGAITSSGGEAGGTAANSDANPIGAGGSTNGTGTTNTGGTAIAPQSTNPQVTTSQPTSSRQGVPALW